MKKIKRKFLVSWCLGGKGFTLIEMVVALAILVMVIGFAGVVFQRSIGSYRTAMAQAEIMRKLRVITEQLDSDFRGLQKDGYLILRSEIISRKEYPIDLSPSGFRADRVFFFCTGDFQSWFNPGVKSNIARIYLGHEYNSRFNDQIPVSRWRLAHDALLLVSGNTGGDFSDVNYAWCQAHPAEVTTDANSILTYPPDVNITQDPNTIRRLLCENAGELKIEWTAGLDPNGAIAWFGLDRASGLGLPIEDFSPGLYYRATWLPSTQTILWPKALKFTFTLYDSRGVFKKGQTFTHIVYIGD